MFRLNQRESKYWSSRVWNLYLHLKDEVANQAQFITNSKERCEAIREKCEPYTEKAKKFQQIVMCNPDEFQFQEMLDFCKSMYHPELMKFFEE